MLLIFIKLNTSYCFLFILFRVLILLVIKLISQTKMSESQGFAIHLSDKAKLEKNAKAKKLLKKISKFNNQDDENEDDDSYSCRFDVPLSEESADLMKSLKELAAICDDLSIEHRVTLFEDSFGDVLGDFSDYDDSHLYIGPSACACAQWEQEVVRTETISLSLNHGETLVQ